MNRFVLLACLTAVLPASVFAQDAEKPARPVQDKQTQYDRASYGIGFNIGTNLKQQGFAVTIKQLIQGLTDAVDGKKPQYSEEQLDEAFGVFQREMQARKLAEAQAAGEKNLKEGKAFLAANAKKPGVKTTETGLQYLILKSGNGATPKATDSVRTHYHGTLINGTVFDSSVERKQPAVFPVNRVIAGWTEVLQLMKVGDKWRVFVPSQLAYGERGAGSDIGPHTTLIFEIELLGIEQ